MNHVEMEMIDMIEEPIEYAPNYDHVPVQNDPDLMDRLIGGDVLRNAPQLRHPDPFIDFFIHLCPDLNQIIENIPSEIIIDGIEEKKEEQKKEEKKEKGKNQPNNGQAREEKEKEEKKEKKINWISSLENEYIIVKGHIQSGKSNFMICAANVLLHMGFNVVVILRNNCADQTQFTENFSRFQGEHNVPFDQKPLFKASSSSKKLKQDTPKIILLLGNESNIQKTLDNLEQSRRKYVVFIDEVDGVDMGGDSKKSEILPKIKEKAYCVFGVSGTVMDPLCKENVRRKNLITLSTPPDYKGIVNNRILIQTTFPGSMNPISDKDNNYSGKIDDDLFSGVQLESFLQSYTSLPPFETLLTYHPRICLINVSRCVEPYKKAQKQIISLFPNVMTLVYTGEGISVSYEGVEEFYKKSWSIAKVLQDIKDNFPRLTHLIIFSGDLAGRGISFKSSDMEWHLTDEFLLVSKKTDEAELQQKIRLNGRYQDDIPLTLYSTPKTIRDLRRAYFRQEEIVLNTKGNNQHEYCKDNVNGMEMSKSKKTSRPICKDKEVEIGLKWVPEEKGWDASVYQGKELAPAELYEAYGLKPPTEQEYVQHKEKYEDDEKHGDEGEIYVSEENGLTEQEQLTFHHVVEFLKEENHVGSWVYRHTITKYLVENGYFPYQDHARAILDHISAKGSNIRKSTGLVFKKEESKWKIKFLG